MGSFIGHIDESTVFLILCLWWMYNGFKNHIKASYGDGTFVIEMSYFSNICGRQLPLENILKILFPTIAICGELADTKGVFWDKEGHAAANNFLMHISIYGLFVLHGIVDLMLKKGVRFIPQKMDFITAAVAFCWYGIGLYFHGHMEKKSHFENMLHLLTVIPLSAMVPLVLLISVWRSIFLLDFLRCYFLALLGTWVTQTAFMMYKPGIPGNYKNPAWDRDDYYNNHYIPVSFGLHVGFVLTFMLFFYAICYFLISRKKNDIKYSKCPEAYEENAVEDDDYLSQKLLSNEISQV